MNNCDEYLPDRIRLPIAFDPVLLASELDRLIEREWTLHYLPNNYVGNWSVLPLRIPKGADHPILQIAAHPDTICVDAPVLDALPGFRSALASFDCPLRGARLMRLTAGSSILEHRDPALDAAQGSVRLHVPIVTNAEVCFWLNDQRVAMMPGETWYLRLSDPHRVDNRGTSDRVHLVIDADMNDWLAGQLARGAQADAHGQPALSDRLA